MEFDKKPNVIKFEGSKLQTTQQLIDELRVTLGQPKYDKWSTNLDGNVTLAETLDELVDALNGLENYYKATGCNGTHYGSVKNGKTSTYNGCSSNKSNVNANVCSAGYVFAYDGCNCYGAPSNNTIYP